MCDIFFFFCSCDCDHRDLHVLIPSFPTRRSSDLTMMRPMRAGMYFNIVQYQEDGVEVPTFYGPPVPIDLSQLRDTNLSTVIGQGLMAIDRQYVMQLVQQIVFALIQNPRAAEQ